MAIFRKTRRSRGGASQTPDAPQAQTPRQPSTGDALRQQLREIADAAVAPEDALEPALRAILEATNAQCGALIERSTFRQPVSRKNGAIRRSRPTMPNGSSGACAR